MEIENIVLPEELEDLPIAGCTAMGRC